MDHFAFSRNRSDLQSLSFPACILKSTESDPTVSSEQEPEQEETHHFYARQHHYPGTTVKRFPVPEEKVPWEVPDLDCVTYSTVQKS